MKILEIKSINKGSTDYVSRMLCSEFKKLNVNTSVIESIRVLSKQPLKWFKFYKVCKDNDILHCHLGKASQFTSYFKKKSTQVSTLHGFQKIKHYKNSDYFTAVSSAVKKHYINQGLEANKIRVIPNGIKEDLFSLSIDKNNEVLTIGQIGHLTKNLDFSLLIIKRLLDQGFEFKFMFVGDQGNIDSLKYKVKKLGIENNVEFLGFVDNIEQVYNSIDILFSSSILEGFCLPILEAMASGIPVVTYNCKGIDDYFIHNENGFIYDNENEALSQLSKLISNKDLRLKIANKNRIKAKEYTWNKVAKLYLNFFNEILTKKN